MRYNIDKTQAERLKLIRQIVKMCEGYKRKIGYRREENA